LQAYGNRRVTFVTDLSLLCHLPGKLNARRSESAIPRAVLALSKRRVQITYKIKTTDQTSADTM
jgi:hypothetical protein